MKSSCHLIDRRCNLSQEFSLDSLLDLATPTMKVGPRNRPESTELLCRVDQENLPFSLSIQGHFSFWLCVKVESPPRSASKATIDPEARQTKCHPLAQSSD
jgi:hypothetical protein